MSYRCATTGHPAPSRFYWNVNGGEKYEVTSSPIFATKITKQSGDAPFRVTCRAEAKFDNKNLKSNIAESSIAVLWGPVANVNSEIEPVVVTEGASFDLKCPFDAFPTAEVAWTKDNQALEGETSSSLTLNSAAASDSGRWTCQANNPVTGASAIQTFQVTILQRPVIISPEKQELGKNASRPMVFCSFKFHFTSESFVNLRWFVQKDESIEAIQLEPGSPATSAMVSDEKWMIRWTDVTSDSATSLLTILDASEEELDAKYICEVSNDIGMTTGEFEITSGLANASIAIISGAVLVLALVCIAVVLLKCNREKKHVTNTRTGKLTPDLIQVNYSRVFFLLNLS